MASEPKSWDRPWGYRLKGRMASRAGWPQEPKSWDLKDPGVSVALR